METPSHLLATLRKTTEQHHPRRMATKDRGEAYDGICLYAEQVLQVKVPVATPAPPWALSYHINAVIHPDIAWDCVPDLLRSLGQLEVWRLQCIDEAEFILTAEDVKASPRYQHRQPPTISPSQRRRLERFVRKAPSSRAKFRILVLQIAYSHILYERARPDRNRRVPRVIGLYFPAQLDHSKLNFTPQHPVISTSVQATDVLKPMHTGELEIFHSAGGGLSEEEHAEYHQMRRKVVQLLNEATKFDDARKLWWSRRDPEQLYENGRFASYTRDFVAEFPPLMDWPQLQSILEGFTEGVNELYDLCYPSTRAVHNPT